jgi:hypothetical protein
MDAWLIPLRSISTVWGGDFDPSYAVNVWDRPAFVPGPFAASEDAVHRSARRVARA